MIVNGVLYENQIRTEFQKIWYDPDFQWYFGCPDRWTFSATTGSEDNLYRHFASIDSKGNLIGYIGYAFHPHLKLCNQFGAINFTKSNSFIFGKDVMRVIDDCFVKFGAQVVEFYVIKGNPAESMYDELVYKCGGRIIGTRTGRAVDLTGNLCDDKLYELTRKDYISLRRFLHE